MNKVVDEIKRRIKHYKRMKEVYSHGALGIYVSSEIINELSYILHCYKRKRKRK